MIILNIVNHRLKFIITVVMVMFLLLSFLTNKIYAEDSFKITPETKFEYLSLKRVKMYQHSTYTTIIILKNNYFIIIHAYSELTREIGKDSPNEGKYYKKIERNLLYPRYDIIMVKILSYLEIVDLPFLIASKKGDNHSDGMYFLLTCKSGGNIIRKEIHCPDIIACATSDYNQNIYKLVCLDNFMDSVILNIFSNKVLVKPKPLE